MYKKSIFVHGVDLHAAEMEIIARSRATLVINPRSNLNNAVGLPKIKALEEAGVRLALGNDGFGANLCAEAQTALGAFSTSAQDPSYGWELLNRILFVNNPTIAGEHLNKVLGVIESGAAADIAIFPYEPPSPLNTSNYFGHYLFGFGNTPARDVIVNGKIRLRDGTPVGFNPETWAQEARKVFQKVWQQRTLRGFHVRRPT